MTLRPFAQFVTALPTSLRLVLVIALLAVCSLSGAPGASADSGARDYHYLLGEEPIEGPDEAMAPNGDVIEITGEGDLGIHPKDIDGGGDFTHHFADGGSISGTWTAEQLLSFHSYGDGTPQGLPPEFEGGLALIRIRLDPGAPGGPTATGVLQVDCLLGKPPAGSEEGIRLAAAGGLNFNDEIHGETLFIRQ